MLNSFPFLLNIPMIGKFSNNANKRNIPINLEFRSLPMNED